MISNYTKSLISGQNLLITSLPGMGLDTLLSEINLDLRHDSSILTINLFPHEVDNDNFSHLDKLVLTKLDLENHLSQPLFSTTQLLQSLSQNHQKLIIFAHKIHFLKSEINFLDYLDSLARYSNRLIRLVISLDYGQFSSCQFHRLIISCLHFIFPGYYSDDYLRHFTQMSSRFGLSPDSQIQKNIFGFTLGHLGLTKSLLQYLVEHQQLPSVSEALNFDTISQRLTNLFVSLQSRHPNLADVFSNPALSDNLGLSHNGEFGQLYPVFYNTHYALNSAIFCSLTPTENKIFQLLHSQIGHFVTLDQISQFISPNFADVKSDWALYRHLHHLKIKLKPFNFTLQSHRSQGYLLQPV